LDECRTRSYTKYSEDQPRDEAGRFGEGGGGADDGGSKPSSGKPESTPRASVSGKGANKAGVEAAVNAIPQDHYNQLGSVEVTNNPTVSSSSGKAVAGLCTRVSGEASKIQVADQVNGRNNKDPAGTATHELGHALDNSTGHKLSSEYGPMIRAAANKMSKADQYLAQHYFQNDREMFAEVYKLAFSPSQKGAFALGQKAAEKRFGDVIQKIRAIKF
jgi:hypothetical protein